MKKDLSCILALTKYLAGFKGDSRRSALIRLYLRHKLCKAVRSRCQKPVTIFGFRIPLLGYQI
jgi:hypothetical protein